MKKCLELIKEDLIAPAIDKLSDMKIDLEEKMVEIISLQEDSCGTEDGFKQLYKLRSTFWKICIRTAVMLEIGAMYMIHMSRGKDAPFYKIDLFRSEDELLDKIEDW